MTLSYAGLLSVTGPPPVPSGIDHPGPHVQPVRVGRAEHRAVIVVADRERLGQRPVERDVGLGEIAHRERALGPHPLVHLAVAPGLVLRRPGVVGARRGLRAGRLGVVVERGQVTLGVARVRLAEHRAAVRQPDRGRVGEAAHARHRAEVVVETAVLLHEDHDVLDVAERAAGRLPEGGGQHLAQAGRQYRRARRHPGQRGGGGEQATAGEFGPGGGRSRAGGVRRRVGGIRGGLPAAGQVPAETGDDQGQQALADDQWPRQPAGSGRSACRRDARDRAELDDPVVAAVGHPDLPGRGDRQALRELQVVRLPGARLQAELGVEAPGRAEYRHQAVVRLSDVDPPARADRDAAGIAEVAVTRLRGAERPQLMPGRGELPDRVARRVGRAGHPDVAADVQPDAGRRRHRERGAVAAGGGELLHPAVALVGDPDVTEGGDRQRDRLVQLAAAASRRTEDGQHPADRGELDHPVVASVRDPDVPGRVGGDAGRLVQVLTEGGHQAPRRGVLRDAVVAGVGHPDITGRIGGHTARACQRRRPERLPEGRRVRQRARRPGLGGHCRCGAGQRGRPRSAGGGDEHAEAHKGDDPRPPAAPSRQEAHRPGR